jgi:ubiquinone/menaquinone biosynthesis C-methylase UbiE
MLYALEKIKEAILTNRDLTKDHKHQLIRLLQEDHTYPSVRDGNQINEFIRRCDMSKDMHSFVRLFEMLVTKTGLYNKKRLVYKLLYKCRTDTEFYRKLRVLYQRHSEPIQKERANYGICVGHYLEPFLLGRRIHSYLDIGIGTGHRTLSIARHLKVKKVFGADKEQWFGYDNKRKFPFPFVTIGKNQEIPYPDSSMDLISCIHVLHHVDKLRETVSEITRLLKPESYLMIVEHDVKTSLDALMADIEHALYERVMQSNDDQFVKNYYARYLFWVELDMLMSEFGMKIVNYSYLNCTIHKHISETKSYVAIYKKQSHPFKDKQL